MKFLQSQELGSCFNFDRNCVEPRRSCSQYYTSGHYLKKCQKCQNQENIHLWPEEGPIGCLSSLKCPLWAFFLQPFQKLATEVEQVWLSQALLRRATSPGVLHHQNPTNSLHKATRMCHGQPSLRETPTSVTCSETNETWHPSGILFIRDITLNILSIVYCLEWIRVAIRFQVINSKFVFFVVRNVGSQLCVMFFQLD